MMMQNDDDTGVNKNAVCVTMTVISTSEHNSQCPLRQMSKLVFYAKSTRAVLSGRSRQMKKTTWNSIQTQQ